MHVLNVKPGRCISKFALFSKASTWNCRKYRCDRQRHGVAFGRMRTPRRCPSSSEVVCQKVLHGAMTNDIHGGGHQNTLPRRHFRNSLFALPRSSRGEENKSGVKEERERQRADPLFPEDHRRRGQLRRQLKTPSPFLHRLDNGLLLLLLVLRCFGGRAHT